MPAFDQLLRRLVEAEARFVLDLMLVARTAVDVGGRVQRDEAMLGSAFSIAAELAGGEQVAIETDLGRLDVVQGLEGIPPYSELRARATEADVLGARVAVCSAADLRAMKITAGRGQDLLDVENLDAALSDEPDAR